MTNKIKIRDKNIPHEYIHDHSIALLLTSHITSIVPYILQQNKNKSSESKMNYFKEIPSHEHRFCCQLLFVTD